MAGSFAKLVVSLGANVSSFETDMKRATRNQDKRMKQMRAQAEVAAKGLAVAFSAVATATGLVVKNSIQAADEMQKLSQRTGLSTEALSQYKHVAELSGVSFEQFTNGMKRMQRSLSDADVGLSTQTRAFERLGLSVDELISLSPDQQFEKIAQAMTGLESATLRSATAQEIFGRSGAELLSVMSEGKDGIEAMRKEAERLGLTIGSDFAEQAALFDDNMARITAGFTGAANSLTAALLPALLDLQAYFMGTSGSASDLAASIGEKLGGALKVVTAAFIIAKNAALGFGKVLLGVFDLLIGVAQTTIAPITGSISSLVQAFAALKAGDFAAAGDAIAAVGQNIGEDFADAAERIKRAGGFIIDTVGNITDGLDEANKVFTTTAQKTDLVTSKFKESGKAIEGAAKTTKKLKEEFKDLHATLDRIDDLYDDSTKMLDEMIQETDELRDSFKSLADELYPVEAATNTFIDQLELLREGAADAGWSAERLADAEVRLAQSFQDATKGIGKQAEEVDLLAVAIDESVRIITRAGVDMWEGFLNGAESSFDAVADSFKSLLADLVNQASTAKIAVNVQQGITDGFDAKTLRGIGEGIGTYAAVILGAKLGGGGDRANTGAAIGSVIGGVVGTVIPVIGNFVGSAIGSILGGLVGGLFEKNPPQFNISSTSDFASLSSSDDETALNSVFGKAFITSRRVDAQAIAEITQGIQDFDKAIGSVLDDDQFGKVTEALKDWGTHLEGEAITIEQLLDSRFDVILSTFSDSVKGFVGDAEDLAERVERLQVGTTAEKLFADQPDLFGGRTVDEFLSVINSFKTGVKTIGEAFQEVLGLLDQVGSAVASMRDFANSDLSGDFQALLDLANTSLSDALAGINSSLMDAIASFNGSPQELQNIAGLVSLVREGELKLLSEIDSIQKGISANLAKLKADLLGLTEGDKTGEQLFNEAAALINSLGSASSAAEVADMAQQFEALIRQISPEDQTRNQSELIRMVDDFDRIQQQVLSTLKQDVIDNAQVMRDLVDVFINDIGAPLDIIAATNQQAAEALETIASGADSGDATTTQDSIDGVRDEVAQIGPVVANAISRALGGVDFNVQVNIDGRGLVTQ